MKIPEKIKTHDMTWHDGSIVKYYKEFEIAEKVNDLIDYIQACGITPLNNVAGEELFPGDLVYKHIDGKLYSCKPKTCGKIMSTHAGVDNRCGNPSPCYLHEKCGCGEVVLGIADSRLVGDMFHGKNAQCGKVFLANKNTKEYIEKKKSEGLYGFSDDLQEIMDWDEKLQEAYEKGKKEEHTKFHDASNRAYAKGQENGKKQGRKEELNRLKEWVFDNTEIWTDIHGNLVILIYKLLEQLQ